MPCPITCPEITACDLIVLNHVVFVVTCPAQVDFYVFMGADTVVMYISVDIYTGFRIVQQNQNVFPLSNKKQTSNEILPQSKMKSFHMNFT